MTDTTAQMTNRPGIPMAAAMTPPSVDPRIVASPDPLVRMPWAVPPVPAGARLARTVTPPTNTHANPTPSSGAMASNCHGSVARAERPVAEGERDRADDEQPLGTEPLREARKHIHDRHLDQRPDRPDEPDLGATPADRAHLDRVERVRAGQGGPHDDEPGQEQRHAAHRQDGRHAAPQADRHGRSPAGDGRRHDDREGQHRDVGPEQGPRPELVEHDADDQRRDDERQRAEGANLPEPVAGR